MKRILILSLALVAGSILCSTAQDAKALYDKECAKCHGADGKGATKMGQKLGVKDYTDAKVQEAIKDDAAVKAIKEGVVKDGKTVMKAAEGVSDEQVKALVAHIRKFKK